MLSQWDNFLPKNFDLKISTSEMIGDESQTMMSKCAGRTFSFDSSDNPRYGWRNVVVEVSILKKTAPESSYEIHFFSNNFHWIKDTIHKCQQANPKLIRVFVQLFGNINIKNIKELPVDEVGVSIDASKLFDADMNQINDMTSGMVNQITLPRKSINDKYDPTRWLNSYGKKIVKVLEELKPAGSWYIDRGVEQNILTLTKHLIRGATIGRGLLYYKESI